MIAAFNASKELNWKDNISPKKRIVDWKAEILKRSGLEFMEILEIELGKLVEKKLIIQPQYGDGSGLRLGEHFRLSELAYNLLLFVEFYEKEA